MITKFNAKLTQLKCDVIKAQDHILLKSTFHSNGDANNTIYDKKLIKLEKGKNIFSSGFRPLDIADIMFFKRGKYI